MQEETKEGEEKVGMREKKAREGKIDRDRHWANMTSLDSYDNDYDEYVVAFPQIAFGCEKIRENKW